MNAEVSLRFRLPIVSGLFMFLVGGWFAFGGVYFASITARDVALACESAFWVETTADLVSVGDDGRGKSPKVLATYRYRFAGREYESDRIAIATSNDNLSSYWETLQEELDRAWQAEQSVRCFVDPSDPTRSLLDRRLRAWPLLVSSFFWVVFPSLGGTVAVAGAGMILGAIRRGIARLRNASQPWLWRRDWAAGRIRSRAPSVVGAAAFANAWNLVIWSCAFLAWFLPNPFSPGWVPWVTAVFALISWRITRPVLPPLWSHLASRSSVLQLDGLYGRRGEPMTGVIVAPAWLREADEMKVELICKKPVKVRQESEMESDTIESKDTTYAAETVRELSRLVAGEGGLRSDQIAIPIELLIPGGRVAPPTDPRGVSWRLEASAKTPRREYQATFEAPIF